MKAFYDATVEIGVDSRVTTFTLSDFGRTLQPSGSGVGSVGSDHGWGNHQFVMGGAVTGGDFYGVPGPNGSVFPTCRSAGRTTRTTAAGGSRRAPSTSTPRRSRSGSGSRPATCGTVFPLLGNFSVTDLGFLT